MHTETGEITRLWLGFCFWIICFVISISAIFLLPLTPVMGFMDGAGTTFCGLLAALCIRGLLREI